MTKTKPLFWANVLLSVPACLSGGYGVYRGLTRGQDLQWSGAHLAGLHMDPYRQYLLGDPQHRILMVQIPNYLHELYVLLLPLGAVPFETARAIWLVLNFVFLGFLIRILGGMYGLRQSKLVLLLLLTLASTPFRLVLGNGQQSLMELLCFCLVFSARTPERRGMALGLSYAKYSFSPVLVFYLFLRRQYRILAISIIPLGLGVLVLWLFVRGPLPGLIWEPLAVSRTGVTPGLGDLMSVMHTMTNHRLSVHNYRLVKYIAALGASALFALYLRLGERRRTRGMDWKRDAPAIAVASLLLCTHLTYDYVFLMLPLAAALGSKAPGIWRWLVIGEVTGLWIGLTFSNQIPDSRIAALQIVVFCLLASMLVLLRRMNSAGRTDVRIADREPVTEGKIRAA